MPKTDYEVIILGTGPAGLQAAIHAARARVSVLVMGRAEKSSIFNAEIENYCCMHNISGNDLLKNGRMQAEASGATYLEEDSIEIDKNDHIIRVTTESGRLITTRAIIFCLGISRNSLNVPGEAEFRGKGVSYCVDCDANFFKGKPVAVIGNGSGAVAGALTLSAYTDEVHLISESIQVSENLNNQLNSSSVKVHQGEWIEEITGSEFVESVKLKSGDSIKVNGVFVELGAKGVIELASFLGVALDSSFKYVEVNKKQETNIEGIYAAGDICGPPWQIAKAVGEGCVAGIESARYVKGFRTGG